MDYYAARQEVINRLSFVTGLPTGVNPQLSPFTPTGELVRYTLTNPMVNGKPLSRSTTSRPSRTGRWIASFGGFRASPA